MKKLFALFSIFTLCVFALGCTPDIIPADEKRLDLNEPANGGGSGNGGSENGGNNSGDGKEELKEDPSKTIRVISYNIRTGTSDSGTDNAWDKRKKASPAMVKDQNPTVFGLQEAIFHSSPKYSQIDYLADNLPDYAWYGVGRENGMANMANADGEYMAIFYKKSEVTLGDHGTFWLAEGAPTTPVTGWDAAYKRTATWAIFTHKASGEKFMYINTHFDHKGANAKKNSVLLLIEQSKVLNPDNYPVVITGDFNMEFSDTSLLPLKNAMNDARTTADKTHHAGTNNNWGSANKIIDYIFYTGFHAWQYKVVNKQYEGITYISDHYPIIATLQFE